MKCAGFLLPILHGIFTEFTFSSELTKTANIFSGAIIATFGSEISVNKGVHEGITSDEIEAGANLLICI